jgi:hypothetical protein
MNRRFKDVLMEDEGGGGTVAGLPLLGILKPLGGIPICLANYGNTNVLNRRCFLAVSAHDDGPGCSSLGLPCGPLVSYQGI